MKTLSITAGLLLVLLAVHCCDASARFVCCFKFFEKRIPKMHVLSISKTNSRCSTEAFVIRTPRGDYCVRQTVEWAQREFIKQRSTS
ncbi:C-C motif chemokine 3-like [Archocentrus centrarchus]|uniref:C-C motif chemokine 3-like n=1 Tax=Archocentrus centrarchus TaxID=63155 RepID=UPI0011EA2DC0|nr:C-C motif chemokine 3-like [Archocentrus centrarchus]